MSGEKVHPFNSSCILVFSVSFFFSSIILYYADRKAQMLPSDGLLLFRKFARLEDFLFIEGYVYYHSPTLKDKSDEAASLRE